MEVSTRAKFMKNEETDIMNKNLQVNSFSWKRFWSLLYYFFLKNKLLIVSIPIWLVFFYYFKVNGIVKFEESYTIANIIFFNICFVLAISSQHYGILKYSYCQTVLLPYHQLELFFGEVLNVLLQSLLCFFSLLFVQAFFPIKTLYIYSFWSILLIHLLYNSLILISYDLSNGRNNNSSSTGMFFLNLFLIFTYFVCSLNLLYLMEIFNFSKNIMSLYETLHGPVQFSIITLVFLLVGFIILYRSTLHYRNMEI
jgi:hypothetical protein